LKVRGFLNHHPDLRSSRKAGLISLSHSGLAGLRSWISGVTEEMGSPGIDPIRTKLNYLAALPPGDRKAFLDRAEQVTRARLELVRNSSTDESAAASWTLEAALLGVEMQLEARLQWLARVRQLAQLEFAN
jgi:hypothetical protein